MKDKPAFMIYHRDMKALVNMSSKDLGDLIKALYAVSLGEDPEPPKRHAIVFDMMAERVREDTKKYEDKVAKNSRAGQASAQSRKSTDVNGRQQMLTDVNQYNTRTIQDNNKNNNNTSRMNDRDDDMSDVLMEV